MEKKEIKEQLEYAKESMGFTPEIMQLIGGEAPEWFKLYRASDKAMWTDTALPAKIKVLMGLAVVAGRLCPESWSHQRRNTGYAWSGICYCRGARGECLQGCDEKVVEIKREVIGVAEKITKENKLNP